MYRSHLGARSLRALAVLAAFVTTSSVALARAGEAVATTGTITATAGGMRSATDSDSGYASPLEGVLFEKAAWVSDPTTAVWSPMCTTIASGACTSAVIPNGHYLVRESEGGPFGWRVIQNLAWGGGSSGASPSRSYVGDVTVNSNAATVHPSTAWSPTAASSSSGPFIVAKNNPPLPSQCGLDVLLLIDRSGSIGPQAATYKAAAQQFVTTMSGTPTRLKIFSFSQAATADQNTFLDLQNAGDVTTANSKLNTIYNNPGGSTNWDAAMKLAAGAGVDVVVFITDGNPTARDSTTSGANSDGGGTVDLLDLTFGIASANKVKTEGKSAVLGTGASILALGVGTGVTAANLSAVSGPVEGTDYSTSSSSGLDTMLQQLANKLCGARIHVRKLTDEGDTSAPKAGWTFTAGKPAGSPLTFAPGAVTTTGLPADDVIKVDKIPAAGSAMTIAETAQANYDFAASQCQKNSFPGAASGGSATATIASLQRNDDWYCTFRNTRQTGTIKVVKNLSPASDAGRFDLGVDGGSQALNVGDGGTTGAVSVKTGTGHTAAEAAHSGTSAADYDSSYVCTDNGTQTTSGNGVSVSGISVASQHVIVCTFTNVRKTGTLKVVKNLSPANDAGRFDLNVDGGAAEAANVGDGGTTGDVTVNTGSGHSASEVAHAGTSLADYTSSYVCKLGTTTVASGTGPSTAGISIAKGDAVVCTFTNVRNTGTIKIIKNLSPANDAGLFDLNVDGGAAEATGVGNNGTTGATTVNTGAAHSVSEAGAGGTNLADYTSNYSCSRNAVGFVSGSGTSVSEIAVAKGDAVVCTFTNTRKTGTIEVVKTVIPASDAGKFDLNVDGGSAEATNVGDGGTTGAVSVNTGTGHSVSEAAHDGTSLGNYVSSYVCTDGETVSASGPGTSVADITVAYRQSVVCTFTNTRKATVTIHEITNPHDATTSFGFHTTLPGDGTMGLVDGASQARDVPPGTFTVSQDDPRPAGYKLTGLVCTETGTQDSTVPAAADIATDRTATVAAQAGEHIDCTFTDTLVVGSTVLVKAGTEFAYHGDTLTYTFTVTNNGNSPLHGVSVTDDRCPSVSAAPVSKTNDNGDALLDQVGADGTNPEAWVYSCSMAVPDHAAGETNPVVNTATVHALDEFDRPVSGQAHHSTLILHPAITIDKTGPATALAGDVVTYALVVKNTGDESFAAPLVVVSDARCEAPPARVSTTGDASPASLDPGDAWGYLCNVQTQLGDTLVHNVGTVDGTDPHGHHATAQDSADTQLTQPAGSVLPEVVSPGSAKLRGQTGCITSARTTAIVTGKNISSVVFKVDGHTVKTLRKADSKKRYILNVAPKTLGYGVHHITARVTFTRSSGTKAKTLKLSLTRCRPAIIKPKFTG